VVNLNSIHGHNQFNEQNSLRHQSLERQLSSATTIFPDVTPAEEIADTLPSGILGPIRWSISQLFGKAEDSKQSLAAQEGHVDERNGKLMAEYLLRNIRLVPEVRKLAVCMGLHPRLGQDSPLYKTFFTNVLCEPKILQNVFEYAFGK
jgi:hypothetical protein